MESLLDIIERLEARVTKLEETVAKLTAENDRIKHNEFVGMKIRDFYCNGFFGRDFSLEGAIIIENTDELLTIRKRDGHILQADFSEGWDMREHVMEWTREKGEDEY